jgi:hypothetical protein
MAHDVFISYSSKDKVVADAVCAGLEGRGIACWIAPRDLVPGVDWGAAIVDAISGSKVHAAGLEFQDPPLSPISAAA